MSSVIRKGPDPTERSAAVLPRVKTVVGVVIVAAGLWLSFTVVGELLAVVSDPNASPWLATFRDLPADARTLGTPHGDYRIPTVALQATGIVLLAVFLYCLTNLAVVILRIGGWMLRDDAQELLQKIGERIDSAKRDAKSSKGTGGR